MIPRVPAVKPGRVTQGSEGCSPVSGVKTIQLCSCWQSDDPPTLVPGIEAADSRGSEVLYQR
jgi:hypothetical protein